MAEVAPGGGTMMVDMTDERAIGAALHRLAGEPALAGLSSYRKRATAASSGAARP